MNRIEDLKNARLASGNDSALIVCNGSSLSEIPRIDFLNAMTYAFPFVVSSAWRRYPSSIGIGVMCDASSIEEYRSAHGDGGRIVTDRDNIPLLGDKPNLYFLKRLGSTGFSLDLAEGYYSQATSTLLALQLAVYLGFRRVCFLGMDLTYKTRQERKVMDYEAEKKNLNYACGFLHWKVPELKLMAVSNLLSGVAIENVTFNRAMSEITK